MNTAPKNVTSTKFTPVCQFKHQFHSQFNNKTVKQFILIHLHDPINIQQINFMNNNPECICGIMLQRTIHWDNKKRLITYRNYLSLLSFVMMILYKKSVYRTVKQENYIFFYTHHCSPLKYLYVITLDRLRSANCFFFFFFFFWVFVKGLKLNFIE